MVIEGNVDSLSSLSYLSSTSGKCSKAMLTNELDSKGKTLAMVTPDGEWTRPIGMYKNISQDYDCLREF